MQLFGDLRALSFFFGYVVWSGHVNKMDYERKLGQCIY